MVNNKRYLQRARRFLNAFDLSKTDRVITITNPKLATLNKSLRLNVISNRQNP